MNRAVAFAARCWRALGDDRLILVVMGACILTLPEELERGGWSYLAAAIDAILIGYGVRAWRRLGRAGKDSEVHS